MQNRTYHVNMQRANSTMQCVQHAAYNTRHAWQCTAHSIQHSVHKVASHYATTSDALPAARRLQVHAIAAGGRSDFMNPPDGARIIQVCPTPAPCPPGPCAIVRCAARNAHCSTPHATVRPLCAAGGAVRQRAAVALGRAPCVAPHVAVKPIGDIRSLAATARVATAQHRSGATARRRRKLPVALLASPLLWAFTRCCVHVTAAF